MGADVKEPVADDATNVEDISLEEIQARQDKLDDELDAEVNKILEGEPKKHKKQTVPEDDKSPDEGEKKPDELSQALKDRAEEAGYDNELAERLHKHGLLEEALAIQDRALIKRTELPGKDSKPKAEEPKDKGQSSGDDKLAELDPDVYGEELIERDSLYRSRIKEMEAKLAKYEELANSFQDQRTNQFKDWATDQITGLKNAKLFGKGKPADGSAEEKAQQALIDSYQKLMIAHDRDPMAQDNDMFQRTYAAVYREEAIKAAQKAVVDRLRDLEGRFVEAGKSGEGTPSKPKTDEEMTEELVRYADKVRSRSAST